MKYFKKKEGISTIILHHIDRSSFFLFEKLIRKLDDELGFIRPNDLDLFFRGEKIIHGKKLLLTFDDGFESNYYLAKEILDPLDIKGLFFVNPNFSKLTKKFEQKKFMKNNFLFKDNNRNNLENINNPEILPMSFSNMRKLINSGHTIGSHTLNHKRLSKLKSNKELFSEIVGSKRILENKLLCEINHFAFPFGDIDSISIQGMEIAKKHYKYIYSGIRGLNTINVKKYAIRRESLNISNNMNYNLLLSNNAISFKDRKARIKLDNLTIH